MNAIDWLHTFTRSRQDRWIGGVCGGLGKHTPIPSWTWRLLFVLLVLIGGTGFLLYILLWIFVPDEPNFESDQPSA
ncbi:MAG: PspC domain-containing protein [Smithellaceae bacterium]